MLFERHTIRRVAKTKALISFAVTAKLICAFVFAQYEPLREKTGLLTRSDTNRPEHLQKVARPLKFWIEEEEELYLVAKTKVLISCAVTAQMC